MKIILPLFVLLFTANYGKSQQRDSLQINVGVIGSGANNSYQPLWLVANRWGAISDRSHDLSTYVGFSKTNNFGSYTSRSSTGVISQPRFYIEYGANLINNNQFNDVILQEAYIKAGYKQLEVRVGRFKYIPGEVDKDLSSGSMGVSGNALPIPQITLALTNYIDVPFTDGWIQIKAQLSHGWLGSDRYLNSFYHEKNVYLRAGKKRFKFFIGAQHYAEWGGRRGDIQLDRSFNGLLNVFFAKNGADDGTGTDPAVELIYGPYHAGDQRGLVEVGFDLETNKHLIHFYHQTPFEGPNGVNIRNIDNLSGISIAPKKQAFGIKKILAEFIYTKQMEGYAPVTQRQSYYNNGYYRTGWEYENLIVGTPLFINRYRAQRYSYFRDMGIKSFDWQNDAIPGNSNIVVGGIVGGNIGLLLQFSKSFYGRTKLTYTNATFQGGNNLNQFYSLQEFYYNVSKSLKISAGFALDAGTFSQTAGGLIGLHWEYKKLSHNMVINNRN